MNQQEGSPQQLSFEMAFKRLEELLEKLNSTETPLEEALNCYKESEQLVAQCNKRLYDAERCIEKLVKNRNDEVALDDKGHPKTEPFAPL